MDIELTPWEASILQKISTAAAKLDMPCWLIGGFVRDKIIGRQTKDMDIVCLGDGIALAAEVARHFTPKPYVSFFKNFGTAQIKVFDGPVPVDNIGIAEETSETAVFEIEFVG